MRSIELLSVAEVKALSTRRNMVVEYPPTIQDNMLGYLEHMHKNVCLFVPVQRNGEVLTA